MKRKLTGAAIALLMLGSAAHAENWVRIAVLPDQTIVEIDTSTIVTLDGITSVMTSSEGEYLMYIDCKANRFGSSSLRANMKHIKVGSIGETVATLICYVPKAEVTPETEAFRDSILKRENKELK